jgi:hypothetical protein
VQAIRRYAGRGRCHPFFKRALAHKTDESGHGLAGVGGIEQNALDAREKPHRTAAGKCCEMHGGLVSTAIPADRKTVIPAPVVLG